MSDHYVLDGTIPVREANVFVWARWFETANRRVAETWVTPGIRISTVFLGMAVSYGDQPVALFETMVFGGVCDQEQDRYETWREAEQGHEQMVARVQAAERQTKGRF